MTTVLADGNLPAQPYRYLHSPPSLGRQNYRPLPGIGVVPVSYLRASHWFMFTEDAQAGIAAGKNAFSVPARVTAVIVHVKAVEPPAPLPTGFAPDGNFYRFWAKTQPGNATLNLSRTATITLRWPYLPHAMYLYSHGAWRRLCISAHATVTASTIGCPTRSLGIVAVVRRSPAIPGGSPATSTADRIRMFLTAGAAILGLIVIGGLAFVRRYGAQRRPPGN